MKENTRRSRVATVVGNLVVTRSRASTKTRPQLFSGLKKGKLKAKMTRLNTWLTPRSSSIPPPSQQADTTAQSPPHLQWHSSRRIIIHSWSSSLGQWKIYSDWAVECQPVAGCGLMVERGEVIKCAAGVETFFEFLGELWL
ncbi:hypothetical protein ACH5RR_031881 [Cinchona calisaya]|uniref:Uncharacterized protein n=1 Tax=Cinchona calisaya TaxID=153742 RepID=A0ABD2YKJ0_9GENT